MMRFESRTFAAVMLALSLLPAAAADQEECLKLVFDRFCLGGDFRAQLSRAPQPLHQQRQGDSEAAIYFEGRERIFVMAYRGRIYKVVRQYRPSTRNRFDELLGLLSDVYGPARDLSEYPHYAESRGARIAAIRRGDGRAVSSWNPGPGWNVELSWTRELGLALTYVVPRWEAERREAVEQRL